MMVGMDDGAAGSVRITAGGRLSADDLRVGRSSNQNNTVLVSGAGSLLSATGLQVGLSSGGKGKLLVTDGGQVQCQSMRLADEHSSAVGEVTVTGSQSSMSVDGGMIIGGAGNGSVKVSDGGLITSRWSVTLGETRTSFGRLTVTSMESVYRVDLGSMAVNNGKLEIRDGGRLELPGEGWLWVYDNSRIELADATICLAGELDLVSHAPEQARASLVGYGTVQGKVAGSAPLGEGIVARGGKLRLGTPDSPDGFRFEGPVKVESDATLELFDQDLAFVWNHTVRLENGVLVARNGLQIDGASPGLAGYGIVVGPVNHAVAAPTGRVQMTQSLRVGPSVARVYSDGAADLGTLTEIFGGTLFAPHGVRLADGDVCAGHGTVVGDVELQNAVLHGENSEAPLLVAGQLFGYGVTIGNVQAWVNELTKPTGTVWLSEGIDVGNRTATVYSAGPGILGTRTTLAGGTIVAANGLEVGFDRTIAGFGEIRSDVALAEGTLRAEGGALHVHGTLSGYGILVGDVTAAVRAPAATSVYLEGLDVGADAVTVFSSAPAIVIWAPLQLRGGSITAVRLDLQSYEPWYYGELRGFGELKCEVLNKGRIEAVDGTLTFAGLLRNVGGTVSGSRIAFSSTGRFTGAGAVEAEVAAAPGSVISPTGELSLGRADSTAGVSLAGELHVGANSVTLRDADKADISGTVVLYGGKLAAPNGMNFKSAARVMGHGILQAGTVAAKGIVNEGRMDFSGGADFFGHVTNRPGARIFAAGGQPLTFWNDVVNDGSVDTGPGTLEVYFGSVTGSGGLLVGEEAELRAISIAQQHVYVAPGGKVVFLSSAAPPGAGAALSLLAEQLAPTAAVPEPSALLLAGTALLAMLALRRRMAG